MRHTRPASFVAFLAAITFAAAWAAAPASAQTPVQPLHATPAQAVGRTPASAFDGVVEAVRQTVIAAQVSGAVVQLDAKVGDRVQAGQLLLRLDARAADQNVAASDAQVQAARASLAVARKDFERQKQLHKNGYISQAALDLAESTFKSAQAEANALSAQAGASRTQTAYHVVSAPFAGVVSDVPVSLGDMAMPGRPLLALYDPTALRVTAAVPQSVAARSQDDAQVRIELPGVPAVASRVTPVRVLVLPTVDAATHSVEMRADLPSGLSGVSPGMFARLWLPIARQDVDGAESRATAVSVPVQAIVRRAELTAVYVLNPQGIPVLRQVRLGRTIDDSVEVLSGLMAGEQVVDDPQAAARVRLDRP